MGECINKVYDRTHNTVIVIMLLNEKFGQPEDVWNIMVATVDDKIGLAQNFPLRITCPYQTFKELFMRFLPRVL